jgi:hypothetical protein
MKLEPVEDTQREARFLEGVGAFMRRDFDALGRTMVDDIEMVFPGTSYLAGTYRGAESVMRCILALRHVLDSNEDRISFVHDEDRMIVRHDITLHGPLHEIEMGFLVKLTFDPDGRVKSVVVDPEDLRLFDHVLSTAMKAADTGS